MLRQRYFSQILIQVAHLTQFQSAYLPKYSRCVGMQTRIVSQQADLRG